MMVVGKMTDGKIVEVVHVADRVKFSEDRGWICVCFDFHLMKRHQRNVKWIRATTPFTWVRDFNFA